MRGLLFKFTGIRNPLLRHPIQQNLRHIASTNHLVKPKFLTHSQLQKALITRDLTDSRYQTSRND